MKVLLVTVFFFYKIEISIKQLFIKDIYSLDLCILEKKNPTQKQNLRKIAKAGMH